MMATATVATAVSLMLDLVTVSAEVAARMQTISSLIQKSQAEGRETFTPDEWAVIVGQDDQARDRLKEAIERAKLA